MKINREQIYNKYNGHCAYCGQVITIKEMQVDHIIPKARGGTDAYNNLVPACRLCNHYKRAGSLTFFRNVLLGELIDRLKDLYIFRVALRYGMITINGWDKTFYCEKVSDFKVPKSRVEVVVEKALESLEEKNETDEC